jgi:hypothetical protein
MSEGCSVKVGVKIPTFARFALAGCLSPRPVSPISESARARCTNLNDPVEMERNVPP